ncbi:hypothetical protein F4778DRAFT_643095 [Xylariomycetidae sp. FL2044]|nr:hypothetical protein F4778DRAFT_643095 [Xylariomycetidae sp. FL2044]
MQLSLLTIAAGLLASAAAVPANKLFARHAECEYSGVTGAPVLQGTCKKAGGSGAGVCTFPGYAPAGCDFMWHNDAGMTPCGEAAESQYACKKDDDPCWAYAYAEDTSLTTVHCTKA